MNANSKFIGLFRRSQKRDQLQPIPIRSHSRQALNLLDENTSIEAARFSAEFAANKATAPALLQQSGMKYWEIVANQLSEAGWTWGHVRFVRDGQYLDLVDAHRGDGKRHIVCADDKLSAFLEMQRILNDGQPKLG